MLHGRFSTIIFFQKSRKNVLDEQIYIHIYIYTYIYKSTKFDLCIKCRQNWRLVRIAVLFKKMREKESISFTLKSIWLWFSSSILPAFVKPFLLFYGPTREIQTHFYIYCNTCLNRDIWKGNHKKKRYVWQNMAATYVIQNDVNMGQRNHFWKWQLKENPTDLIGCKV